MKSAHGLKFWIDQASSVDVKSFRLNAPVHVLVGEGHDVASFATRYWNEVRERSTGHVLRPGLKGAVKRSAERDANALTAHTAADILSIADAVQEVQTEYLLTQKAPIANMPLHRAHDVLDELTAVLEYFFDDGKTDADDAALAALEAQHHDSIGSSDGLAAALVDFAAMANEHRRDLDGLGGFDVALIDEARKLVEQLHAAPTSTQIVAPSAESKAALAKRNQLLALLALKVAAVRSAAKFVFRGQPEIAREAMSAYERRTRAASRRRAKGAKQAPATTA